jgi:hypothetical protein
LALFHRSLHSKRFFAHVWRVFSTSYRLTAPRELRE